LKVNQWKSVSHDGFIIGTMIILSNYTYTIFPNEFVIFDRLFCFLSGFFLFLGDRFSTRSESSLTLISVWTFLESNTLALASVWTSEIFLLLNPSVLVSTELVWALGLGLGLGLVSTAGLGLEEVVDVVTAVVFGLDEVDVDAFVVAVFLLSLLPTKENLY